MNFRNNNPWHLSLSFFILGLVCSQITKQSPAPELTQNLWHALPAFFIFVLFCISLLSLGAWVRTLIQLPFFSGSENALFDLSVGTLFFYLASYLLTGLHLFSSALSPLLWFMLSVPILFGINKIKPSQWFSFVGNRWGFTLLFIPLLIVFIKLIEGIQFPLHGDAYVCYLPGPRIWAVSGNFHDFLKFTQFFLTTSWESLYAWGTALMGLQGGIGLDLTQFFAQWCTGGIATLGIIFAALSLSKRLAVFLPVSCNWHPIVAVCALQVPVLRWTSNLAKNDTGVAFLGFSAFYFSYFLAPTSLPLALLAGMLTGAAVIGKLTLSFLGLCIGLGVLYRSRKHFLFFSLGGILGILPVILRNYFLTGSPVFPWLPKLFPTPYLGPTLIGGASNATKHVLGGLDRIFFYLNEFQNELPLWGVVLFMLLFFKNRKQILKPLFIPVCSAFLFTLILRSSTEIRYQNATLVILAALVTYLSFYFVTEVNERFKFKWLPFTHILLTLFFVLTASITTFTLFQIGSKKFQALPFKLASLTDGEGKLWIRQNLKNDRSILIIGDPHLYYLIDYPITELVQSVEWDTKITTEDRETFKQSLKAAKFDYLYLVNDLSFFNKLSETTEIMKEISTTWKQSCKLHETSTTQIWDLQCLKT